jgi:hypothetical protein
VRYRPTCEIKLHQILNPRRLTLTDGVKILRGMTWMSVYLNDPIQLMQPRPFRRKIPSLFSSASVPVRLAAVVRGVEPSARGAPCKACMQAATYTYIQMASGHCSEFHRFNSRGHHPV